MAADQITTIVASHPVLVGLTGAVLLTFLALVWATRPITPEPKLPGPKGYPIVGNLFQRGSDPADTYHKWSKIYGPVFKIRLGNQWSVVINSAKAGDELLTASCNAPTFQSRPAVSGHRVSPSLTTSR
jgi:hypothetical protein